LENLGNLTKSEKERTYRLSGCAIDPSSSGASVSRESQNQKVCSNKGSIMRTPECRVILDISDESKIW
jgi:hypothetical protein